jgi:hypothetical protein
MTSLQGPVTLYGVKKGTGSSIHAHRVKWSTQEQGRSGVSGNGNFVVLQNLGTGYYELTGVGTIDY